jgi:hypothetical protein
MLDIKIRNCNQAFHTYQGLVTDGFTGPITMLQHQPTERVTLQNNPFHNFLEGLMMLAGYKSSKFDFLCHSDGYFWKKHFGVDQINLVYETLKADPLTKNCIIYVCDPLSELPTYNTYLLFSIRDGYLDMTAYSLATNIAGNSGVTMLQEFLATKLGINVGKYILVSNSIYWSGNFIRGVVSYDRLEPYPLINGCTEKWLSDLVLFLEEGPVPAMSDIFFRRVANPILQAWIALNDTEQDKFKALVYINDCEAEDLHFACKKWIEEQI